MLAELFLLMYRLNFSSRKIKIQTRCFLKNVTCWFVMVSSIAVVKLKRAPQDASHKNLQDLTIQ